MKNTLDTIAFLWIIPAVVFIVWGGMREMTFTVTGAVAGSPEAVASSKKNRKLGTYLIAAGILMIALSILWWNVSN